MPICVATLRAGRHGQFLWLPHRSVNGFFAKHLFAKKKIAATRWEMMVVGVRHHSMIVTQPPKHHAVVLELLALNR